MIGIDKVVAEAEVQVVRDAGAVVVRDGPGATPLTLEEVVAAQGVVWLGGWLPV